VLVKCHRGCDTETVVRAIGLEMSDLFPNKPARDTASSARIDATYDYVDEDGRLAFQVVRFAP
jgi:putative DNA primase/helicase